MKIYVSDIVETYKYKIIGQLVKSDTSDVSYIELVTLLSIGQFLTMLTLGKGPLCTTPVNTG